MFWKSWNFHVKKGFSSWWQLSTWACKVSMNLSCFANAGEINCVDTRNIHLESWKRWEWEVKGNVYFHSTHKWCIWKQQQNKFYSANGEFLVSRLFVMWIVVSLFVSWTNVLLVKSSNKLLCQYGKHHLLTSNIDLSLPFGFSFSRLPSQALIQKYFQTLMANYFVAWNFHVFILCFLIPL